MAAGEIHVGDIGTVFTLTLKDQNGAVVDITGSTANVILKKPNGTKLTKTGTIATGTDGKVTYTTVSGDLSTHGRWEVQVFVDLGVNEFYSDVSYFTVHRNL